MIREALPPSEEKNVLGETLQRCSVAPLTGFFRTGCCETSEEDAGVHTVCAVMTAEFLAYTRSRGNDLSTPAPHFGFPGLKPGDRWCLCADRWKEAMDEGHAPPVILSATHEGTLRTISLDELKRHAYQGV